MIERLSELAARRTRRVLLASGAVFLLAAALGLPVLAAFATRDQSAAAVDRVRPALGGSGVRFGGNDVAFHELSKRTTSDLSRAEMFAFPLLLALSFWVFRGLVAAALPLLVGGFAIVVTFLLLRAIDQFTGLSIFAVNLVTGLGLGLG